MIFVDGSVPRGVADALKRIGKDAKAKTELFPQGTEDTVWLREVGLKGWLAITRDGRIRTRPGELQAIMGHSAGCFILTYKNHSTRPEIIELDECCKVCL